MSASVSVIAPTFNRARWLGNAIRSALQQLQAMVPGAVWLSCSPRVHTLATVTAVRGMHCCAPSPRRICCASSDGRRDRCALDAGQRHSRWNVAC